jgi:hypothetical protein
MSIDSEMDALHQKRKRAIIRGLGLRPITNECEYEAALLEIDHLTKGDTKPPEGSTEDNQLGVLRILVGHYEALERIAADPTLFPKTETVSDSHRIMKAEAVAELPKCPYHGPPAGLINGLASGELERADRIWDAVVSIARGACIVLALGIGIAHAEPAPPPPPTPADQAAATVDQDLKTLVTTINMSLRAINDDMLRLKSVLDAERAPPPPPPKPAAPATPPGSGQQ